MSQFNLLSVGKDAKTVKGNKFGYLTGIMYLSPASMSGVNVCPGSSAGCRAACLFSAGHGVYKRVQDGRMRKTKWFLRDREGFMRQLIKDIQALVRKAERENLIPVVRPNGTSDLQFENFLIDGKTIFEHFPNVRFMDYTKILKRVLPDSKALSHPNYHLTFSRSESNDDECAIALLCGVNVAAVFRPTLPPTLWGVPVVSGDTTDLRFIDAQGVIVGLTTKGRAKKDESGFVINVK